MILQKNFPDLGVKTFSFTVGLVCAVSCNHWVPVSQSSPAATATVSVQEPLDTFTVSPQGLALRG